MAGDWFNSDPDTDISGATGAIVGGGELATGIATANPIAIMSGAASLFGTALSIFGTSKAAQDAQEATQIHQQMVGTEQSINDQRQQQMVLTARRQSLQEYRNYQQARAKGLANATASGSQFSSGLKGGLGQESGEARTNLLGIGQNLQIGQNIFGLDAQLSSEKISLANVEGSQATNQGLASLGGSISRSAGPLGNVLGGLFPQS